MAETEARDVCGLVDHLFRHSAGRIVSSLTRVFGAADLELVEDAVQEALEKALKHWPFRGIPENPGGWLFAVARNAALDRVRRRTRHADASDQVVALMEVKLAHMIEPVLSREIADDQLRMMFTCCHPDIPTDARVALTLKTIGGFGVREIAHAFLAEEQTIAQRLVRAKRRIREQRIPFAIAEPEMLAERLSSVLDVLYLMFNEGYNAGDGDLVVRRDVCAEALRLVEIIVAHPETGRPETHALAALFCFQAARFPARQGPSGDLLLLSEQDRSSWDGALIERGARHMECAAAGDILTSFHLEAGVAACHAVAPSFEETDWRAILRFYDQLVQLADSPIFTLNRSVAVAMIEGPAAGLAVLDGIVNHPALARYYLLPATRGEFYRRLDEPGEAGRCFEDALRNTKSAPVRRHLEQRIAALAAMDES
ncbi:MAG: sigma-70 family RNA polymerase sigma factor [Proteobacteria bacterium]|nr:sigma-70 family RNA polymerase sigma factor [Pseudomonadota bacterium]MDA1357506.1 sigma-70 family RNA polymerase sigma factor [Pseudomonadota bacterium]